MGAAALLYDRGGNPGRPAARRCEAQGHRGAHPQRRRRDRAVPEDRLGLLRALRGRDPNGRIHCARQKARPAVRGVARWGIRAVGGVLRRAVQAGPQGSGADHPGQALGRRAGGARQIGERCEGDDGGGETLTGRPMATSVRHLEERGLGATLRRDSWWVAPALTRTVLFSFAVYATWSAWTGAHYASRPHLSPFYSPLVQTSWWPLSPAFLILVFPLGFRVTCYYYRKAYYRAFFLDPVACAVGEARHDYHGETRFPFIFQNLHRFFMYAAVIFIFILSYDVFLATRWPVAGGATRFGIGIGTLVMLVNVILLASYTFGCHSLRHLIGGQVDCFSCARGGKVRVEAWRGVS